MEHCEQLPNEEEKLIFLHEGLYPSTQLAIDIPLQMIGAGMVLFNFLGATKIHFSLLENYGLDYLFK